MSSQTRTREGEICKYRAQRKANLRNYTVDITNTQYMEMAEP